MGVYGVPGEPSSSCFPSYGRSTGGLFSWYMGSRLSGWERGTFVRLRRRRLMTKKANAASAIRATGTATAGPTIAPMLFELLEEGAGAALDDETGAAGTTLEADVTKVLGPLLSDLEITDVTTTTLVLLPVGELFASVLTEEGDDEGV